MPPTMIGIGIVVLLLVVLALSRIRIAREYEMGVVFRLGRLIDLEGPGLPAQPGLRDTKRCHAS
jgi:regulator of protease activity HflC (stomatin/prohibitin superfamily)